MAMPGYVLVFVVLGQYDLASPLQSSLFGGGLRIPGIRTPAGRDLHPHRGPLSLRVRARSQRVPRPVAPDARSGAFARQHLRAVGAPGRVAARPSRARRRRRARGDGSARRLRHRQPPRRAGAHERDLPGVERCVRPGGRAAARHRAADADARHGHDRAAAAGPGQLQPGARSRRRGGSRPAAGLACVARGAARVGAVDRRVLRAGRAAGLVVGRDDRRRHHRSQPRPRRRGTPR